ncbi:MAG: AAA family ATPase [Euryarchaeota archaeon]|nr:AAA family ATPase [Euryarchaeota archaeon]
MKTIFLSSMLEYSGKSTIALGLAKNFEGRLGYYKPFREEVMCVERRVVDRDAHMMKHALDLDVSEELLSPMKYDIFNPVSMESVLEGFERVKDDYDCMLVEGAQLFSTGARHNLDGMSIATELGAEVILVSTGTPDALDKIMIHERLAKLNGQNLKGVILNRTDDPRVVKMMESAGVNILGCIPTTHELNFPRVKEFVEGLNAEVLAGEEGLNRSVEKIMVGGMTAESAQKEMRRLTRKALIAGGDRSAMLMSALSTDTSCLILTGGLYPDQTILVKAEEQKIPVLLVGHGTQVTADMVDKLITRIDPLDTSKIEMVAELVRRHVDLNAVWGD